VKTTGSGSFTYRARPVKLPSPIEQYLDPAHSSFVPDRAFDCGAARKFVIDPHSMIAS
jgi:hypothetical protein